MGSLLLHKGITWYSSPLLVCSKWLLNGVGILQHSMTESEPTKRQGMQYFVVLCHMLQMLCFVEVFDSGERYVVGTCCSMCDGIFGTWALRKSLILIVF